MKREPKLPVLTAAIPAWAQELQGAHLRPVRAPHATASPFVSGSPTQVFLRVDEAAAILKVSSKTVRRLLARGDLRAVRIGRSVRIQLSEIERLIAGGVRGGDFGGGKDHV
jgi:excisionase family DNA binding protein